MLAVNEKNHNLPIGYFKEIFEVVTEGLMVVGVDGKILLVNGAMAEITGQRKSHLVGSACTVLNCDACEVLRSESEDKWCMLFEKGRVKDKRCLLIRKDGSYASVIKNASLLKSPEGTLMGAIETFADVSEMDRRSRKIQELIDLLDKKHGFHGMVGETASMKGVFSVLEKAALYDSPVMIYGERGTGKKLAGKIIHEIGRRRSGQFIQINCAALDALHTDSELFGHVRGAFDGAYRHHKGHFENAHAGDILLDEIADIPLPIQAKILQLIETKKLSRVGDLRSIPVDTRIIAATSRDPRNLAAQNKLREDLLLRLNVVLVHLPPLRDRIEDVPLLVKTFIDRLGEKNGKHIVGVNASVMTRFMGYHWPGNVRELSNALEYAFIVAEGTTIEERDLPAHISAKKKTARAKGKPEVISCDDGTAGKKAALIEALRQAQGNKTKAAEILGVHRMTVWNRMRKYGVQVQQKVG